MCGLYWSGVACSDSARVTLSSPGRLRATAMRADKGRGTRAASYRQAPALANFVFAAAA